MSSSILSKVALVALMVGTALVVPPSIDHTWLPPGLTLSVLAFGIINATFAPAGTEWVRAVAIGATFAALLWPSELLFAVPFVAWLIWPPAFMVMAALGRKSHSALSEEHQDNRNDASATRIEE